MSSNSPSKIIKFSYLTEDRRSHSRTPSSHKRKKIFEGIDSPKQYSPFTIIESNLNLSVNDEIQSTFEKINRKLQKMQYLELENQRLSGQNYELKNAKSSPLEVQAVYREKARLEEQLLRYRQRFQKGRAIVNVLKDQKQLKDRELFAQLCDIFEL